MAGELGFDTGPFVNVAAFCEKVLHERDDVLSLIRVVDRLTVTAQGPDVPDELPHGNYIEANLVLLLRGGEARGPQTIRVSIVRPDTTRKAGPEQSVPFSAGEAGGATVLMPLRIEAVGAGVYWAEIEVNRRLVTKVSLELIYTFTRDSTA